ncbi:YopX family protein [Oceanobacillus oncorhynchi]|uniref:YopX family protein n=1 Tax=Oceanobacillus oncorhynchi TaxID=545501 RepID=UPI002116E8BD|nr:YopX family protein [Oceanobacillus oncorhynchi]UUI41158.1 YopX family protein [Oceanobacillus oncorhynchi]
MREFKFNAWIKAHEIMVAVDSIDFAEEEILIIDDTGIDRYFPFEEIELLQYTGLRDKNGKEIYEGDLIKKQFKDRRIGNFYAVGQVVFSRWYAGFTVPYNYHGYTNLERLSSDVDEDGWIVANQKMDVIGNIYKNPELLEGATNGSS